MNFTLCTDVSILIHSLHIKLWLVGLTHAGLNLTLFEEHIIFLLCINIVFLAINPIEIWLCWYNTLHGNYMRGVHAPIATDACDDHPIPCMEGDGRSKVSVDNTHWSCSEVPSYLFCTAWSHSLFTPRKPQEDKHARKSALEDHFLSKTWQVLWWLLDKMYLTVGWE